MKRQAGVRRWRAGPWAHAHGGGPLERLVAWVATFVRDWIARFFDVQGIDRAMALGAQVFTAVLPLLIVYSAVVSGRSGDAFADRVSERLQLGGTAAESLHQAFSPSPAVQSSVTVLSVVLLVVSALAFTRALQRLYEGAFRQRALGYRGTPSGLLWLALFTLVLTIRPVLLSPVHGVLALAITLALSSLLWLATPYLMLGRRVPLTRLAPCALLTAGGMTALFATSFIWMPRVVSSSAGQFGVLGVGFALLSWLFAAGVVLILATTGGAVIDERLQNRR
jgi:membrane protein